MTNVHVGAPSLALLHMLTGCWISQALYVAAKLGIADLLQEGPQSCTRLAEATQTHAETLYRVLRALASVGVFVEDEEGCFSLTPLAEPLRTDAPGSLRWSSSTTSSCPIARNALNVSSCRLNPPLMPRISSLSASSPSRLTVMMVRAGPRPAMRFALCTMRSVRKPFVGK